MFAPHHPVLYKEIIHALRPMNGGCYIDGTLGAGGHAEGILQACAPSGRLLGLDLDPLALRIAGERLAPYGDRAVLRQASYLEMAALAGRLGWQEVNGIVLDLGVSSMQLDTPDRGFSFLQDAPLDMRFDPGQGLTAADLVNTCGEEELADIIFRYGEDRNARRIARSIVRSRPLHTTAQLAAVVASASGKRERIHPATRTFQALRIAVNDELEAVANVLPLAAGLLGRGGRLAVITFHSLEDRLVKDYFHRESRDCLCPPRQPVCTCGHRASLKELQRKPFLPGQDEIDGNSRARSAKLRVCEKL